MDIIQKLRWLIVLEIIELIWSCSTTWSQIWMPVIRTYRGKLASEFHWNLKASTYLCHYIWTNFPTHSSICWCDFMHFGRHNVFFFSIWFCVRWCKKWLIMHSPLCFHCPTTENEPHRFNGQERLSCFYPKKPKIWI